MDIQEFVRRYYVDRRDTNNYKYDELEDIFGQKDLVPMWIADMDFKTPNLLREALKKRIDHGVFGYSPIPESYLDAVIKWNENEHEVLYKKESIRVTTGVIPALYNFVQIFTQKGDAVLHMTPVYHPFETAVLDNGRKLIECPLKNKNGIYTIDFKLFEETIINNNVKLFINCTPHNPVGRIWDEGELDLLYSICRKHNVLVVSDEIHQDFEISKSFIPSMKVMNGKYKDILLITQSSSKTFNLAGFTIATVIIDNDELRKLYDTGMAKINPQTNNILSLLAVETAYTKGKEWKDQLLEVIRHNYRYLKDEFENRLPEVVISPLEGTYLAWLDLRNIINPESLREFITNTVKLAPSYGEEFSKEYKGFIRLNLATHPNLVKKVTDTLINTLIKHRNENKNKHDFDNNQLDLNVEVQKEQ